MEYVLTARPDGILPAVAEHRALSYKVLVTPVMSKSWAAVECACGAVSHRSWSPGTTTFLGVVALAWLDGCGKAAYVPTDEFFSEVLP